MLTAKQQKVTDCIRRYWATFGCSPSIRDLCAALDITSPNGVMCHLKALARKGAIELGGDGVSRQIWPAGLRVAIRKVAAKG